MGSFLYSMGIMYVFLNYFLDNNHIWTRSKSTPTGPYSDSNWSTGDCRFDFGGWCKSIHATRIEPNGGGTTGNSTTSPSTTTTEYYTLTNTRTTSSTIGYDYGHHWISNEHTGKLGIKAFFRLIYISIFTT